MFCLAAVLRSTVRHWALFSIRSLSRFKPSALPEIADLTARYEL
jgi:hypothetical protein